MELRHLRYFLAVAEQQNFTRAAERLGIGQPPLSQQIKDLEVELGVRLFHRVPHGAELTDAGHAFREQAKLTLEQAEHAKLIAQRAARGESGTLRLGFTGSAAFNPIVPQAIRMFRRAYPKVALSLVEANTAELLENLDRGAIDAAFVRPGLDHLDKLRIQPLSAQRMLIVLPASHPAAARRRAPLSILKGDPLVMFPRAIGPSLYDEVIAACRRAGFEPELGQEAPQISSVVNLVAAELGVSIVPAPMAQLKVAGVEYLNISGDAPIARLALATRRAERSAAVKNFIAVVPTNKRS